LATFTLASGDTSQTVAFKVNGVIFALQNIDVYPLIQAVSSGWNVYTKAGSYMKIWPVAAGEAVSIGGWS